MVNNVMSEMNPDERSIKRDKFPSSMSAMNVIDLIKDQPNIKIKRNKKTNYRSNGSSHGSGLVLPTKYKLVSGVLSTSIMREKKQPARPLLFTQDINEGKHTFNSSNRQEDIVNLTNLLPPKSSRIPRTHDASPFEN